MRSALRPVFPDLLHRLLELGVELLVDGFVHLELPGFSPRLLLLRSQHLLDLDLVRKRITSRRGSVERREPDCGSHGLPVDGRLHFNEIVERFQVSFGSFLNVQS